MNQEHDQATSTADPRTGRRVSLVTVGALLVLAGGLLLVIGGAIMLAGVRAADPPPEQPKAPAGAGTAHEVIVFTADGPIRIRVRVTIAGRPAEDVWRSAVDVLFDHCDRNGDGSLDAKERQAFQQGGRGQQFVIVDGNAFLLGQSRRVQFTEKNGKVDRTAFRDGMRASGLGPVAAVPTAPRGDSGQLADVLFKRLDTDGDGKLSVEELKAARDRLAPIDMNEDELITPDELLDRFQNPFFQFVEVFADDSGGPGQPQLQLPDVYLPASGRMPSVKDLLELRDKDKDGALSAAEMGCDPKVIAELDADGDGRLDADELAAWLRRPADVELTVDLSEAAPGPEARPFVAAGHGRFADRLRTNLDGTASLALTDARFRFAADSTSGAGTRAQWTGMIQTLREAFKQVSGGTGVVERQKLAESPELNGALQLFDFADRDGDGKVTAAELDRLEKVLGGAVNCRTAVGVTDQGRGLFELLDTDGDGQLCPRELLAAPGLVAALDRDGDGKLSRAEISRGLTISVKLASVEVFPVNGNLDLVTLDYSGRQPRTAVLPPDVPEWFRNADRNGDGDVSAREFPGPPALFRKIDTNGDGLISPDEAREYEKRKNR
jgi:Ca2+-binding EF-hand superfamily protein